MGYFRYMYGIQSDDFVKGVIAAIDAYSVWRNGVQYIGSPERPIKEEIEEAVKDLAEHPEKF
jgi:hypothetical protein